MKCLTLDILCQICFSAHIDSFNQADNQMVYHLSKTCVVSKSKLFVLLLPITVQRWLDVSLLNATSAKWFVNFAKRIISERKQQPEQHYSDLLQMLHNVEGKFLDSKDDSTIENQSKESIDRLSEKEIIGNIMVFLFAASEGLTSLFSEPLHLLAQHPDIQEKLYQEVIKTFPDDEIDFDKVSDCKYLNAVMDEVLRMRFSVVRQFRTAAKDYDLHVPGMNSQNRIHLKAGQVISVSSYSIHHNPDLYSEPLKFRPERFLNGEVDQGLYMPYGTGPRICIAYRFANVMLRYVLIQMIKNYRVSLTPSTHVPLRYKLMSVVMDYDEMRLQFQPRNESN